MDANIPKKEARVQQNFQRTTGFDLQQAGYATKWDCTQYQLDVSRGVGNRTRMVFYGSRSEAEKAYTYLKRQCDQEDGREKKSYNNIDGFVKKRCHQKHHFEHMFIMMGPPVNKRYKSSKAVQNRSLKRLNRTR